MGKKKRQNQTSNSAVVGDGDSSDSEDSREQAQCSTSKPGCLHIKKSVDQGHIQKNSRSNSDIANFICTDCKKASKLPKDIWICLKCGSCGCGSEDDHHACVHFEVPRSDSHCVALQLDTWTVWCFKCQQEIPADCNKRLNLAVDYVKQQCTKFTKFSTKSDTGQTDPPIPLKMDEIADPVPSEDANKHMEFSRQNKIAAVNGKKKKLFQQSSGACEVSGLSNLGNTCFFNSVLQCLAQTPGLLDLLRQMEVPGEHFYMPVKDAEPIDTMLDGTKGNVSEALCSVLEEVACMKGAGCERGDGNRVVNPSRLLSALRKKCPQFEGGDQHDAHELLRHLLDTVRTEDLRRYQEAILHHVGLSKSTNPKEVDEKRKRLVKSLKQPLCDMLIRPDHIFRGSLVSTLVCQNCNHTSERHESFLDLSLPVSPEKPQPPAVTRRNKNANSMSPTIICEGGAQLDCKPAMSKHQLKKERKQQQRRGRSKRNNHASTDLSNSKSEPTIMEEDKKDSDSEDEQSDADVEDNEDGGCEDQTRQEVTESGYSSEKQMSPRESPLTHSLEEDSDVHNKSPVQLQALGSESGLGSTVSVQELTVSIPENQPDVTIDLISPDSTRANASPGSPEISSDSLQEEKVVTCSERLIATCSERLNETCVVNGDTEVNCTKDGELNRSCVSISNKNEVVFDWECNPFSGNENSDECDYNVTGTEEAKDNGLISSFVKLSVGDSCINQENKESNIHRQSTSTLGDSSRSTCLAVCTNLEENLISPLVSPQKLNLNENNNTIPKETAHEVQLFCDNIARSSPVEMPDSTELDSKLLNLSLEAYKTENKMENEKSDCTRSLGGSDEELQKIEERSNVITSAPSEMGFVLVGGIAASGPVCNKNVLTSPEPLKNVDTSDEEDDDTEYELGRSKQATLSGRYQSSDGECSLQTCLSQFTAIEMLAGNNKVGCSVCTKHHSKGNKECKTVYTVHSKQLLISQAPPVLIFHLKRFQVQMFSFRKLSRHVAFPLILDIAPFCSAKCESVKPGEKQILYSLYGVVEHSGTLHGGHYIAYVKVRQKTEESVGVPPPGKWYYISDSRVMEASESSVLSSQAYLLFYERIL